jgi:hypothetical protein
MPDTFEKLKDETYTEASKIKYGSAKTESIPTMERTYQYSVKVQSAPTNRTGGEIKLRIAPREMPTPKSINSTK